jgi:hypothetical protein
MVHIQIIRSILRPYDPEDNMDGIAKMEVSKEISGNGGCGAFPGPVAQMPRRISMYRIVPF